jgi:predicted DNA-binding protein
LLRTIKHQQAIYLEHERAKQLDRLAQAIGAPKAVLLREAVDDLLIKYKVLRVADLNKDTRSVSRPERMSDRNVSGVVQGSPTEG